MEAGELLLSHRRVHAVETEGGHAHALHDDGAGQHVGAGGGPPLVVAIAGHQDGPVAAAGLADAQNRRPGLRHGHDALHQEEVHPRRAEDGGLPGVELHQLLEGGLPVGGDGLARGPQVSGHQGLFLRRLPGEGGQPPVVVLHLPGQAEGLQGALVAADGGGDQHVGAGAHIGPLELQQGLRMCQGPLRGAGAGGHAPLLQLGAGGAVHQKGQG